MKKYVKCAILMACAALFAACGYESVITPIQGTDLSTYTAKTEDGKIVLGVQNKQNIAIIPAAYDKITLSNGVLIADYTSVKGKQLYNLYKLNGTKAINAELETCEWKGNHFRTTCHLGEFLYYPEIGTTFGPYQSSIVWQDIIFYNELKNNVSKSGFVRENGTAMQTNEPIFVIKDKKSGNLFFAIQQGKKAVLYDYDLNPKTDKTLSAWSWSQLKRQLTDKQQLSDKITLGSVANIKAF